MTADSDPRRQRIADLLAADPSRMRVLTEVAALGLPDCWIGGGFVRSPVWDHLSGRAPTFPKKETPT